MINKGEHVIIAGQTGSGKSVMLQELLRKATTAPVIVLDSKIDDGFLSLNVSHETLEIFSGGIAAYRKYIKKPVRRLPDYLIIRPPVNEVTDPTVLDEYLQATYNLLRGGCVMAVDELYMIHDGGRAGNGLVSFLTRGRSANKSFYGATQRPRWVSRFCFSEATHYFIFKLMEKADRASLQHIGYSKEKVLDNFHFFYYGVKENKQGYFKPIPFKNFENSNNFKPRGWI